MVQTHCSHPPCFQQQQGVFRKNTAINPLLTTCLSRVGWKPNCILWSWWRPKQNKMLSEYGTYIQMSINSICIFWMCKQFSSTHKWSKSKKLAKSYWKRVELCPMNCWKAFTLLCRRCWPKVGHAYINRWMRTTFLLKRETESSRVVSIIDSYIDEISAVDLSIYQVNMKELLSLHCQQCILVSFVL